MNSRTILVTNDDGMFSPGIRVLTEVAMEFGNVVVVAPNSPQSAKGHAITIEDPLRLNKIKFYDGIEAYECSGTPVDCVKLAKNVLLKDRNIDLCVSGINHGSNASINIIYSGTISAAMEAALEGIPSVGFSLLNYSFEADLDASRHYTRKVIDLAIRHGIKAADLLNVNIPDLPMEQIKGMKICRQADGRWEEEFKEGIDPRGQKYYWLSGKFVVDELAADTDIHALNEGYVSIVPSKHDLTAHEALQQNNHFNT
jgi:5'-nucleotidase